MWIRSRNRSCLKNTKKVTRKMVTMISASLLHVLPSTKLPSRHFHTSSSPPNTATIIPRRDISISVRPRADDTPLQSEQQKQMDLSVLRFTLGIPGLDESYLPRYLGIGFGSLILLNHFLDPSPPTPPQIISEVLGIILAAFSVTLPFIGKFLKIATMLNHGSNNVLSQYEDFMNNTNQIPELSDVLRKCLKKVNESVIVGTQTNNVVEFTEGLDVLLEDFCQQYEFIREKQMYVRKRSRQLGKELDKKLVTAICERVEMRKKFFKAIILIVIGLVILGFYQIEAVVFVAVVISCAAGWMYKSTNFSFEKHEKDIDQQRKLINDMTTSLKCFKYFRNGVFELKIKIEDKGYLVIMWKLKEVLQILEKVDGWIEEWMDLKDVV